MPQPKIVVDQQSSMLYPLFALLLCLQLSFDAFSAEGKVTLLSAEFPPYLSTQLKRNGPFSEIMTETFALAGYETTIHIVPWSRAIKEAKSAKFDGLFPAWYTDERAKHFVYSIPFVPSELGFYKLKSSGIHYKTLADLKPYTIAIVQGYAYSDAFTNAKLNTMTVMKDEQAIILLCQKNIDLVLTDKRLGQYLVNSKYSQCADKIQWLKPSVTIQPHYFVISKKIKGHQKKIIEFNRALSQLIKQGRVKEILREHGLN